MRTSVTTHLPSRAALEYRRCGPATRGPRRYGVRGRGVYARGSGQPLGASGYPDDWSMPPGSNEYASNSESEAEVRGAVRGMPPYRALDREERAGNVYAELVRRLTRNAPQPV
jgi:hypothetical protein